MKQQSSLTYVFHHIPKCGGTSLIDILSQWFTLQKDYKSIEANTYPTPIDLTHPSSDYCLCGHFEDDGFYLHQRYPETLDSENFRLFTFLRDPLQAKLSLIRYECSLFKCKLSADSIVARLMDRTNYLSARFPVSETNYKEVIDRYFFVGVLERYQQGLDLLASMIDKPALQLGMLNKSVTQETTDIESKAITQSIVHRFREANQLDYLVYDYCVARFEDLAKKKHSRSHIKYGS